MINPLLAATAEAPIPAAQRWKAAYDGRLGRLIDLAQAIPGAPPPASLLQRLADAAGDPRTASYGPILGDVDLRQALATDINDLYRADASSGEIAITAGCNQAFFVSAIALAKPGDEVLLPSPWYFNHKMTLDMLGITARPLPCRAESGFVPRVEDARAIIGPKTRAIVLVTPNNPTGAVYPAKVLRDFQSLAREAGLTLIVDETYRDFLPPGIGAPHDLLTGPDWRASTVQLYSFSKSYAVPGHRLGAILADAALLRQIEKVLDCMMICPPRATQVALAWAIEGIRPWRNEVRNRINRRSRLFSDALASSSGWSISAIGAYFAYVRHPLNDSSELAAEKIAASLGVVTLPSTFFGSDDGHLRFALANIDEASVTEMADRLQYLR